MGSSEETVHGNDEKLGQNIGDQVEQHERGARALAEASREETRLTSMQVVGTEQTIVEKEQRGGNIPSQGLEKSKQQAASAHALGEGQGGADYLGDPGQWAESLTAYGKTKSCKGQSVENFWRGLNRQDTTKTGRSPRQGCGQGDGIPATAGWGKGQFRSGQKGTESRAAHSV